MAKNILKKTKYLNDKYITITWYKINTKFFYSLNHICYYIYTKHQLNVITHIIYQIIVCNFWQISIFESFNIYIIVDKY